MKISDLHTHPSFKPYHNDEEENNDYQNMWNGVVGRDSYFYKVGILRNIFKETARDSQSNLNELVAGDVQTASLTIHPIERGWFMRPSLKGRTLHKLIVRALASKKKLHYVFASMTGISLQKSIKYFTDAGKSVPLDYYKEETYPEYDYIASREASQGSWEQNYEIVKDHQSYEAARNAGKMPLFLNIEGGHSLLNLPDNQLLKCEYHQLTQKQKDDIRAHMIKNIDRIKGNEPNQGFKKEHTPIYFSISHMYQNFLAGHARTYIEGGWGPDFADLLDQKPGLNMGLTDLGREAIELLISDQNGSRIIIDVKHLSAKGRKEYYQIAKQHNIPIIGSHIAMAGVEDFSDNPRDSRKDHKKNYFSRWSVNFSNEDARMIHETDGIMGIALHEGRMPGGKALKKFKEIKKAIRCGYSFEHELRLEYMKLIMGNIFQIILAIGEKDAWKRIMIGSDFDGVMNPFDIYPTTGYFQRFVYDLEKFLEDPVPIIVYRNDKESKLSVTEIKNLMFGYTPNQIKEMIALDNFEDFIKRHF